MPETRRQPGNLGPIIGGYAARLEQLGYTAHTIKTQLSLISRLGRWMAIEEVGIEALDASRVEQFLVADRASGRARTPTARSFDSLLDYLRHEGLIRPDEDAGEQPNPFVELIINYRQWLEFDRGLAPTTVHRYETLARKFLGDRRSPENETGVTGLDGAAVSRFLLDEFQRLSTGSAKGRVADLRSLLRFLHARCLIDRPLAGAVPPVAGWHDTTLPATVSRSDVERLLVSCDRSTVAGARDFAILMLLARLGLRSIEVARLELEDVHWRTGELVVRGKGRREDRLPLGHDVGEAIVAYLSIGARTGTRRIFLTVRPPARPIVAAIVGEVVERACRRTGLERIGAHRLRHSLATELLHQGASLIDISQVLRHQDLATTSLYAKVDIGRLRQVAAPWPEAAR